MSWRARLLLSVCSTLLGASLAQWAVAGTLARVCQGVINEMDLRLCALVSLLPSFFGAREFHLGNLYGQLALDSRRLVAGT